MYVDGVWFVHKTKADDQARNHGPRAHRLKQEGVIVSCKGKKESVSGKVSNFFVAVSYWKGVVLCKKYLEQLNGENFPNFARKYFPAAFKKSANPKGMPVLQDGDPTQNSREVKNAFNNVSYRMFSIPARSSDINPIENMFNNVCKKLREDAIEHHSKQESYEEFCNQVKTTLLNCS